MSAHNSFIPLRVLAARAFLLLALCGACGSTPTSLPTATASPQPTPPAPTLTLAPTRPSTVPGMLVGRWLGGYHRANGTSRSLLITVESETQGRLTIEPHMQARTLTEFKAHGDELRFSLSGQPSDDFQALHFAGRWLAGELIIGEVDEDGTAYAITLHGLADSTAAEQYAGLYTFPSGRSISLLPAPSFTLQNLTFFAGDMTYTDFESGALRGVYPVAPDTFLVGGTRGAGYPFIAQITFDRNGSTAVAGLIWRALDPDTGQWVGEAETGTRLTPQVEQVRYTSADGTPLAGQLTLPNTPGPHPVFVMLHGSERGRRNGFGQQLMSTFMASQGIALLAYDKRGVGDSGGTYRESANSANLELLAQDVVAGVEYLKRRSDIDLAHIGLIGSSQAGWIIPIAASQSSDVDFFIILSGPVVSVGHEDLYSAYTNDGESPPRFTSEEISKQLATFLPSGFDPVPVLAAVTQPGLWLWGNQDKSIPIPESAAHLEALIAGGQTNFSYSIFPNADHSLQQSPHGLLAEIPYSSGFTEQHYPTLTQWLRQHIP